MSHVEDLGCCARLVFYTEQTAYESDSVICVVKRKIVLPRQGMLIGHLGVRTFLFGDKPLHLVE